MTSNNSPGLGGVNGKLMKHEPDKLHHMLLQLFQRCLNVEDMPQEWRTPHLIPIHKKKGPKNKPNNYRGITIVLTIGRLYTKIIRNVVEKGIEGKIGEEQSGFAVGR
jgi:hypothetical protein